MDIPSWRPLAWTLAYACKRFHWRAAWGSNVLRFVLLPACDSDSFFTAGRLYRTEPDAASRSTTGFGNAPAKWLVVLLPIPIRLLSLREILHATLAASRTETARFATVTPCRYAALLQFQHWPCWRKDAPLPRHIRQACLSFRAQARASNNSALITKSASSSPAKRLADRRSIWQQPTVACAVLQSAPYLALLRALPLMADTGLALARE